MRCAARRSCMPSSRSSTRSCAASCRCSRVMVVTGGLLLLEPDFGAFVVIVAIAFGILFLGGLDWRLFLGLALLLPIALGGDPRRGAVPHAAADGVPRSVVRSARQGLPAFALADRVRPRRMVRRRVWASSVEKLLFLPEAHTDFLLAVIAEELGFAGVRRRHRAVHVDPVPRLRHRPPGRAPGAAVRRARRARHRRVDRRAGVHQHRRQHGRAARPRDSRCRSCRSAAAASSPTASRSRSCCASTTRTAACCGGTRYERRRAVPSRELRPLRGCGQRACDVERLRASAREPATPS